MGILLTNDFNKNLAEYFASKYLYPDLTDHGKPDIRKLVEQPWHLYKLSDFERLLNFYKNPILFILGSDLPDFNTYQKALITSMDGYNRTNTIWSLFGLHLGNGENFLSCSGLLSLSNGFIKKDFGEESIEYVKLCYWLGWTRKKIDDTLVAKYWFLKAKGIILRSSIKGCEDYLKWCKMELESEN